MTSKSPTPQGISALLKRAGFTRSVLYGKGPRRGEVNVPGFRVTAGFFDGTVIVRYWDDGDAGGTRAKLRECAQAITAAGFVVEARDARLIVTARKDQT